jgi:hypothetical protein
MCLAVSLTLPFVLLSFGISDPCTTSVDGEDRSNTNAWPANRVLASSTQPGPFNLSKSDEKKSAIDLLKVFLLECQNDALPIAKNISFVSCTNHSCMFLRPSARACLGFDQYR